MRLKAGQNAPLFAAKSLDSQTVSLAQYAGRRLLLSFYRAAVCPLCNLRTWHLASRYADYRRQGLDVVVFFESGPEQAHEYLDRLRAPFPIVADRSHEVYGLYGLESSLWGTAWARLTRLGMYREARRKGIGGGVLANVTRMDGQFSRMPADFLIGPDLRVRRAYYGRDAGDFLLFAEIERFMRTGA